MKRLLAATFLFTSCAALAAQDAPPAQDYHYGEKLDIKRVVQSPDLDFCGIREVEMTYEDSGGQRHRLRYPVWGQGCGNQN
ncbi:DUF2790 domain-containing protein [Pseudomonas sp. Pseusp97]|uniref:DUF2790 domain-containing protein n=1 Tax=Pseudomonas sp. Pseusp97 TaxID=3243065 RepID=UPI0039A6D876